MNRGREMLSKVDSGPITEAEAAAIARSIAHKLTEYAQRYDVHKYPPAVYEELKAAFRNLALVERPEIERALRWKFGHRAKLRIPEAHSRLIADLAAVWPTFIQHDLEDPHQICRFLLEKLKRPDAFVTIAFLTHLICGECVPIIDQHNLRAINHFIGKVREGWIGKSKPNCMGDVWLVKGFLQAVPAAWPLGDTERPDEIQLDRFLMMYGKAIKPTRSSTAKC